MTMTSGIVVMTCAYHLGDNAATFEDATWVGDRVSLPMRIEYRPPDGDLTLLFEVRDLDVWDASWPGHPVYVDDQLVGRLKPPLQGPGDISPDGAIGELRPPQIGTVVIDRAAIGELERLRLSIVVDRQRGNDRLMDDFVLRRIESVDWVLRPGW